MATRHQKHEFGRTKSIESQISCMKRMESRGEIRLTRILRRLINQGRVIIHSPTYDVKIGNFSQYDIKFQPNSLLLTHFEDIL